MLKLRSMRYLGNLVLAKLDELTAWHDYVVTSSGEIQLYAYRFVNESCVYTSIVYGGPLFTYDIEDIADVIVMPEPRIRNKT